MNILLVEDDAGLVELITVNLEELGFSVISAATGAEALAHLEKQTPDLMLLDYSLPDINGKELIETLINQQTPPPPFILTTGQGDERIAVDMMKLGALDYLVKDILFLEKLPDVVQRVIKEIESESKLKQAEKTLIENEVRFRAFMNASNDPTFIKDDNFRYLFANEQIALFFNRTTDKLIGKTDEELAKLTQVYPCQSSDKRVLESNEQFTIEEQLGDRIFEVTKLPLQLPNNKKGIGGIMKDITDRVLAEKALKASEERFKLAMNATKDGLFDWNLATNEIYFSPGWKSMLGYKDEELANDFIVWEKLTKPDDAKKSWEIQKELISKQLNRFELEIKLKHKEGYWVDILSRAEIFYDENGKAIRMVGTHVDITERKLDEKTLNVELKLFEYAINHSEEELLQKFLDEAEELTDSKIGFYHYIEDDQESISLQTWSSNTINNICKGSDNAMLHYPISKAGVWVDCIKERKPVIHNDYSSLTHKKGLPEGHAPIKRELVVPVIRGNQIKAVLGVGNKESNYNENDVKSIQRLADVAWETVLRKQAEEKIHAAEKNLKNTFDLSPSIICKANLEIGYFIEANQAVTRILGYSVEEFLSIPFIELIHPDDRQESKDEKDEQLDGKEVTSFENRYLCKDGSYKWIAWYGTTADENGIVTAIGSDITNSKLAQLKLAQSTMLLETSQSIAKLGGWELDIATNNLFWTAETYSIHETSPEEFSPTVDAGVGYFLPESRQIIAKALKTAIEEGKGYDLELETHTTKGRRIDVRTTCEVILLDGHPVKLTGIFQDITDIKQAEKALKESEERYRSLIDDVLDTSSVGIFILDSEFKVAWINKATEEYFGIKRENVIGKDKKQLINSEIKGIFEDPKYFTKKVFDTYNDNSYVENFECHIIPGKDREERWLSHWSQPITEGLYKNGRIEQYTDITERKKAEEKIQFTEENLKNTFDLSPSIIAKANMNEGRFIQVNKVITKILGYTIEEFTSTPYMEFVHPDDRQSTIDIATEQLKGNDVTFFENRYLCKDGSYKWMAWHGTKPDKNGIVTTIGSDINERKKIEQEIVKTKQFYENITEGVQDGILVTDENDVIFYANTAMERIAGAPRDQIQGNNILIDFPKETTGELNKFYQQAKKEKQPVWYDVKVSSLANKDSWQNGWLIPQYQNNVFTGIICTIRDVTERKLAEGDVRRLSTAVEQSPAMVVITDTQGIVEYVNPKFTELTGYTSSEAIGQESNILKSGEQDRAFYNELWAAVESGKVWRGQFHNKKKNGELFWEAASISAISNESGEVVNFIKIGEDITQQKIIEEELKIALEKALESDRLKSAFLANMSHEIRTPMNGILGFVELLNEPDLSKSQIGKYSSIINKSGDRLLNTINDIIDISKVEAGEVIISTSQTSINNEIEELYSFFLPEAKRKGLSLFVEPSLSAEPLIILTDNNKLHGILTNLIKNAIKYTERGSITFGYFLKNDFIEFYVKDTGIGIPKNRLKAIFNRFEQADISDKLVFEGSGLGLAISKAYVEMLGGEISVESDENIGSKFIFSIPYIRKTEYQVEDLVENIETDSKKIKKLNLLIAEDDEVSSEFLKTTLEGMFSEIILVDNGKDAVETCRNNPELDLVLMDIRMPVMNGYEATRQIRKFNKDMIIIAQTAYALIGDKEKAIEAGCNDYITKPINKTLLLEIIYKLLES